MEKTYITDDYAIIQYTLQKDADCCKIDKFLLTSNVNKVILPDTIDGVPITSIESSAFENNDSYRCEELILPSSINKLSPMAFRKANIGKVYIPRSISVIPKYCFLYSKVEKIEFEDISSITSIERDAFNSCCFKEFEWPNNCKRVPELCFTYCKYLTKITGMEDVKSIGESAFLGTNLNEFVWPHGCHAIPQECFAYCKNLEKITGIEDVKCIGGYAFRNTKLKDVNFEWPRNCECIPEGCFKGSEITEILGISKVKTVGHSAFENCTNLKSIEWPPFCCEIPVNCFAESGLASISNLVNVTLINIGAFRQCNLKQIELKAEIVTLSSRAFSYSEVDIYANDCLEIHIVLDDYYLDELSDFPETTSSYYFKKHLKCSFEADIITSLPEDGIPF